MQSSTPYGIVRGAFPDVKPIHLSIQIRRDVTHFSGLADVIEGLQSLDGLLRTEMDPKGAGRPRHDLLDERANLIRFRVNSDPVADLIANHPWLSLVVLAVTVVKDYEKLKSGSNAIVHDAKQVVTGIVGLTKTQRAQVAMGVQLLVEHLLEGSEDASRRWVDRLNRVRKLISGTDGELPVISISDDPFVTTDATRRGGQND